MGDKRGWQYIGVAMSEGVLYIYIYIYIHTYIVAIKREIIS